MTSLKRAARDNMTAPRLMAAGAVALGAAAFAFLRDEQRRSGLMDTARRWRDELPRMRGRHGEEMPQMTAKAPRRGSNQAVPALP